MFEEVGLDYTKLLDGVVEGGVCFNRELYNQKLEWDQYENVTYDMDITTNQLTTMAMYLQGNLNKFNILKNSCATVALRAWNAAVGTRNGKDTAYKLTAESDGIFKYMDAPKGVRDNIRNRLPGYYLNNAEGVAEPGAGYQDDTGWVYVSAPKPVSPINYVYDNDIFTIDGSRTKIADVMNAAKVDLTFDPNDSKAVLSVLVNGKYVPDCKTVTVEQDTEIKVLYAEAEVKGMPKELEFKTKDATYQLNAKTRYTGLLTILPIYDTSITYVSSDPLVNVD